LGLAGRAFRNTGSSFTLLGVLLTLNLLVSILRDSLHEAWRGRGTYSVTAFSAIGQIRTVVWACAFALGLFGIPAYATSFNAMGLRRALCKISGVSIQSSLGH
jgi:hypothetical protein